MVTERVHELLTQIRAFEPELQKAEPAVLSHQFDEVERRIKKLRTEAKERGLWLPQLSTDAGGLGLSLTEFAHVSEALGRNLLGHISCNCQAPDAGNMEVLLHFGTDAQKEEFLAPLLAGQIRSCFGMTEPGRAGSNPTVMDTTAKKSEDGWILNGRKWFTTAADGAKFCIVMAVTVPDAPRHRRASMFVVPMGTPGFHQERKISVMGEEGHGWMSHSELSFTDVLVPHDALLGESGEGFVIAQERLGPGRIHHCMRWIGICERAFELMCERAVSREISPTEVLADKQTIQNFIAESRAEIDAARMMVMHAASMIETSGTKGARVEISTIKFYTAGVLSRVLDRALQVHGALGMTDDLPISFWYRHERAARIYDGPDEVHKSVVARHVLKSYRTSS